MALVAIISSTFDAQGSITLAHRWSVPRKANNTKSVL